MRRTKSEPPTPDNGRPGEAALEDVVARHTVLARPPLCPELELHLITDACPLWRADEAELARIGLEAPFWAFAWPGGQALARYLLDRPDIARGRRVLDFGAGGGVEALAAARAGARSVRATDLDPVAVAACRMNARRNGLALDADTEDVLGRADLDVDLVLAGDVTYEAGLGERVVTWLEALAARGVRVLAADPGRGFLPEGRLVPVASYDAPSDVDVGGRHRVRTTVATV